MTNGNSAILPENCVIDWKKISSAKGEYERMAAAADEVDRVDYIDMSNVILNRRNGSSEILRYLDNENRVGDGITDMGKIDPDTKGGRYRLKPYKRFADEDGKREYKPGDVVKWKMQITNKLPQSISGNGRVLGYAKGKKLGSSEIDDMIRRGDADQIQLYHSAVVDEHGLITVSYEDAKHLLMIEGFHYETRKGISRKQETTLKQYPNFEEPGKQILKTQWNWNYEEVPPWLDPANKPQKRQSKQDGKTTAPAQSI